MSKHLPFVCPMVTSPKHGLNLMTLFESSILDRLRPPRSPLSSPTWRELVGVQNDRNGCGRLFRYILDYTAIRTTGTKDHERTVAGDVKRVLKGMSPTSCRDASGISIYTWLFELDIDIMSTFLEPKNRTHHWCIIRRIQRFRNGAKQAAEGRSAKR